MTELKLFALYIGGYTATSHIEVHDMRFAIAQTVKETYDTLRAEWWGDPKMLHLDAWAALTHADGWQIALKPWASQNAEKLYFVNLGGYNRDDFTEQHKNVFVVATGDKAAKARALTMVQKWQQPHKDFLAEVETCICLSAVAAGRDLYIHLEKSETPQNFTFTCAYTPLGRI